MSDDILELAAIAHSAWAAAVRLYYPAEHIPIWEQLDDDDSRPFIAVAEAFCAPADRSEEDESILYEFEHELRTLRGKRSGRKVGATPPEALRLRRPTARELLRSQTYDEAEQDLRLVLCCAASTDESRPFDWPWMKRTHPEDANALRALVLCGWTTLQHELHDAWREGELELAAEQALAEADYELVAELEQLEGELDEPRPPVLDAIEARRRKLASERTLEFGDPHEPTSSEADAARLARARAAAQKLWSELPELPDWFELTAAGDNVTRDIWRQVARELAKAGEGLRLFTPGLGCERLEPKRSIETGDIVLRRKDAGERGVLAVVAQVCGVELDELLRLHHDDYERVLSFGGELLGKSGTGATTRRFSKLSARLRRSSARRSRSRSPSRT